MLAVLAFWARITANMIKLGLLAETLGVDHRHFLVGKLQAVLSLHTVHVVLTLT